MFASISCTVPARAALAGNPSDGHRGAVVATVVPALTTTVSVTASERFGFDGRSDRFDSIDEIDQWLDRREFFGNGKSEGGGGFAGDQPLMQAAASVLHRRLDADLAPHHFGVCTTIPRSIGLAGSSAMVIAAIRATILAHSERGWAQELIEQPELIASLALDAERDVLGIAAGLQDRVVQTLGGTVAMEFGADRVRTVHGLDVGSYRPVGPLPDGLFIAFREGSSSDSGSVHAAVDSDSEAFLQAMRRAADAGRAAASAIDCGDATALGAAMDATFDQRAAVYSLDRAHVEMIDVARANAASANFAGSGGAVVVLAPDDCAATALFRLGCTIVSV